MKTCKKCNTAKPTTEFYKSNYFPDGLETVCKQCRKNQKLNNPNHRSLPKDAQKQCTKCKLILPVSNFSKKKETPDGLQLKCKKCCSNDYFKYKERNRGKISAKGKRYRELNAEKLKHDREQRKNKPIVRFIKALMAEMGCYCCGENDINMLSCHHIDPSDKKKKLNISLLDIGPVEDTINEMTKCIVLCFNHHQKAHNLYGKKMKIGKKELDEMEKGK